TDGKPAEDRQPHCLGGGDRRPAAVLDPADEDGGGPDPAGLSRARRGDVPGRRGAGPDAGGERHAPRPPRPSSRAHRDRIAPAPLPSPLSCRSGFSRDHPSGMAPPAHLHAGNIRTTDDPAPPGRQSRTHAQTMLRRGFDVPRLASHARRRNAPFPKANGAARVSPPQCRGPGGRPPGAPHRRPGMTLRTLLALTTGLLAMTACADRPRADASHPPAGPGNCPGVEPFALGQPGSPLTVHSELPEAPRNGGPRPVFSWVRAVSARSAGAEEMVRISAQLTGCRHGTALPAPPRLRRIAG